MKTHFNQNLKRFNPIFSLFILLIIGSTAANSQDKFDLREAKNKHEISIGVADLLFKQQPSYYPIYGYMDFAYYPYYYDFSDQPKITLKYKYSFGNMALRAGIDFSKKHEENENDQDAFGSETTYLYTLNKIGIEWQYDMKHVELYYGADLYYMYNLNKSEYDSYYTTYYDEYGNYIQEYIKSKNKNTSYEYGLSPFIGIKYFINENFSIGAETNYLIGKYKNVYTYKYIDETSNSSEGTYSRFGHVGMLSFNVHF